MKLAHSFTLPEQAPIVPERLAERITDWLPGATKIDVKIGERGGWRVINTIHLDGNEEPSDVYTMVKACADHHVMETGEGAKYRALVWRMVGVEHERRRVTFYVRAPFEEEEEGTNTEAIERRDQSTGWRELVDAQQRFVEFLAKYNERATDRVLDQSKQDSERLNPLADVIHELVGPYRDGLRMKADAVREVGELRVRQQIAEAQMQDRGKFWEMFGPAIQIAAAQAQHKLMGGGAKRKALPPASVAAPVVQRREVPTIAMAPSSPPPPPPPSSAAPPPAPPPSRPPVTLHELAAALLDGLGSDVLMRLMRLLDERQREHLEVIASAYDDDTSAEAIVGLMQSLMANPAGIVGMQQTLGPDQIAAFQQIAVLAKRHIEERGYPSGEATAPSSGDVASPGKDGADS
ncbi:MAG: hypothetical protein KC501_21725 [Myxococcales bacterium]|nr:hypothetical protein [Myxococcales bacterium]